MLQTQRQYKPFDQNEMQKNNNKNSKNPKKEKVLCGLLVSNPGHGSWEAKALTNSTIDPFVTNNGIQ